MFAALLLDENDIDGSSDTLNNSKREGLNAFFKQFTVDLLVASQALSSSSLESLDLEIKLLPSENDEEASTTPISKASASTSASASATNFTPMRIVIDGTMVYHLEDEDESSGEDEDGNHHMMLLEDKISHTLTAYFSFWRTDEMNSRLSEYGLSNPQITAVRVDGKVILVAATNNAGADNNNNVSGAGGGGGDGNLLVVPTNDAAAGMSINGSASSSSKHKIKSSSPFFTLVVIAGSTLVVLWTVLV